MSKYLYPYSGSPDRNPAKEFIVRPYYHRSKGDRPARRLVKKGNYREVLYFIDGSFYPHNNPRSARATVMYEPRGEVDKLSPDIPIAKQCIHKFTESNDADEIDILTPNRAKMYAMVLALQTAFTNRFSGYGDKVYDSVVIACDLEYIVRGITEWVWGWRERGWVRSKGQDVKNVDLWKIILLWLDKLERHGVRVRFWLVDRIKGPK